MISPNIFGGFLDVCPNHFPLGLPYASRSLGFEPPLPLWSVYKEPLGYIEGEELKSKETRVHCCRSLLILDYASLCPFGELCVLPKLAVG